ncbi:MAG: gamma-glutamyltransferase family protein [Thermomicrobiales bacterium]|nr:gamma-glutamyltransferase family protein [Thermomicrobiales bacterium]
MRTRSELMLDKTEVVSKRGIVAAMHPLAAEAGIEMLELGGNAIDAAVATGFAIGVVEPFNSGLGGIAVMVAYDSASGKAVAIDGTSPLPSAIHPGVFTLLGEDQRRGGYGWRATKDDANHTGYLSPAVPGTPSCLLTAHERYGKLPREVVMAPAIRLAEEGALLHWYIALVIAMEAHRVWPFPELKRIFTRPDGSPLAAPVIGGEQDRLVQPELAETLRRIARNGADGYYKGETARLIAADMAAHGGLLTEADLAAYSAHVHESVLRVPWRNCELIASPVNNGSPTVIETLKILEHDDLSALGFLSSQALHLIIEAQRRSFQDRFAHLGDPTIAPVPLEGLVSDGYAAHRRTGIDPNRATPNEGAGDPWPFQAASGTPVIPGSERIGEGATTNFTVIDGDRNMVACVSTLGSPFGSGVVPAGTGVVLNNGVMWFDPEPGSLVSVGPGKRLMTAGSPTLVLQDGQPKVAIGSPGGRRVITAVAQVLLNILDYGMGPQAAITAPRVHTEGARVEYDTRIPAASISGLEAIGHVLTPQETTAARIAFARPNAVVVDHEAGLLRAGVVHIGPATAVGIE